MAAEPVWQPNYVDLGDELSIRFGAQCVVCDARYATPGESINQLLIREVIPDSELQQETQNAKRYIFREFDSAYSGMLVICYRCRRPACPDCWDDDNKMCGECVAARGLARSPRRGLPSSHPLSSGRLVRVEPGRYSDAQRPSWLDALIATQSLDEPLGTPPKQPAVKLRSVEEPANRPMFDGSPWSASSPGTSFPDMPSLDMTPPGMSSPGAQSFAVSSPGMSSPGMSSPSMPSPGVSFPGVSSPGAQPFGMSSPGAQSFGVSSPGVQSFGVSSPGMSSPGAQPLGASFPGVSSPGAVDRAAQESYPGGAFASAPSYGGTLPSTPFASQPEIHPFPASTTDQFSPFSPPASPPSSQMAGSAWEYAPPGGAAIAESGATAPSPGSSNPAMVVCPRCGTSNYDFVTRCTNCQLQLIQNCPRCQQLNPGYATQCELCGEPLTHLAGWSEMDIPAVPGSTGQTRGHGKQVRNATRRQPKVSKDGRVGRQDRRAATPAAGPGTGESRVTSQKLPALFEVKGGILIDYMEAHPIAATLSLWGERLLTAIVVIFVAGLVTSIATAELSATANETLRGVLHIDIRQTLAQFMAQMQILLDRFKR
ncbi:MAG: hypothetical protein ACXWQZ_01905 [Ktedonobacterales bacterium]